MGGILHTIRTTTVNRPIFVKPYPPARFHATYNFESSGPTLAVSYGDPNWIDTSLKGTVTTSSTRALVGTQSKLSTTSNYVKLYDTVARYASFTGFVIQGFVYITGNAASYYNILGVSNESGSQFINLSAYQNQTPTLVDSISGSGAGLSTLGTIPLNQWVHVFMCFGGEGGQECYVGYNGNFEKAQTGTLKRDILLPGFSEIDCAYLGHGLGNYGGPNSNMWCDPMAVQDTFGLPGFAEFPRPLSGTYTIPTPTSSLW